MTNQILPFQGEGRVGSFTLATTTSPRPSLKRGEIIAPPMSPSNRLSAWLIILLIGFTIINPTTAGDLVAFFLIAIILLHKLFGEYLVFVFLTLRPTLDVWRDFVIAPFNGLTLNVNAAISGLLLLWSLYFLIKNRF